MLGEFLESRLGARIMSQKAEPWSNEQTPAIHAQRNTAYRIPVGIRMLVKAKKPALLSTEGFQ
jgi:hypothetical protein